MQSLLQACNMIILKKYSKKNIHLCIIVSKFFLPLSRKSFLWQNVIWFLLFQKYVIVNLSYTYFCK